MFDIVERSGKNSANTKQLVGSVKLYKTGHIEDKSELTPE